MELSKTDMRKILGADCEGETRSCFSHAGPRAEVGVKQAAGYQSGVSRRGLSWSWDLASHHHTDGTEGLTLNWFCYAVRTATRALRTACRGPKFRGQRAAVTAPGHQALPHSPLQPRSLQGKT